MSHLGFFLIKATQTTLRASQGGASVAIKAKQVEARRSKSLKERKARSSRMPKNATHLKAVTSHTLLAARNLIKFAVISG